MANLAPENSNIVADGIKILVDTFRQVLDVEKSILSLFRSGLSSSPGGLFSSGAAVSGISRAGVSDVSQTFATGALAVAVAARPNGGEGFLPGNGLDKVSKSRQQQAFDKVALEAGRELLSGRSVFERPAASKEDVDRILGPEKKEPGSWSKFLGPTSGWGLTKAIGTGLLGAKLVSGAVFGDSHTGGNLESFNNQVTNQGSWLTTASQLIGLKEQEAKDNWKKLPPDAKFTKQVGNFEGAIGPTHEGHFTKVGPKIAGYQAGIDWGQIWHDVNPFNWFGSDDAEHKQESNKTAVGNGPR